MLVCVLKGAVMFMADLARHIDLPVEMDFMAVSSYGSATKTSGVVRIVKDLDIDLGGRDVLVVEDIVDSGLTLNYLLKNLAARHPASLEVCTLLLKEGQQKAEPPSALHRLPPPEHLPRGLRPRCRRALPEPAGHPYVRRQRPAAVSRDLGGGPAVATASLARRERRPRRGNEPGSPDAGPPQCRLGAGLRRGEQA